MALRGREAEPPHRLGGVLGHARAIAVHEPEIELRRGVALRGREAEPPHRLGGILGHTLAIAVHEPEIELRRGVALRGCEAVPPHRLGGVLGHACAIAVHEAEIELRRGVALRGCEAVPPHRLGGILGHTLAIAVHEPEIELRVRVSLFGVVPESSKGGGIVASLICLYRCIERLCCRRKGTHGDEQQRSSSEQLGRQHWPRHDDDSCCRRVTGPEYRFGNSYSASVGIVREARGRPRALAPGGGDRSPASGRRVCRRAAR